MIDPPQVRPEEPTAVTPHGGICGGESQQWLSYPTDLHVRFDERGVKTGATGDLVRHRQTKGAATDMVDLKSPASHSDSTGRTARRSCRALGPTGPCSRPRIGRFPKGIRLLPRGADATAGRLTDSMAPCQSTDKAD
jgi:hypothetical protein